ncbi:uncharacterized protein METZ01_LOCUS164881, partial [marine metagenome]
MASAETRGKRCHRFDRSILLICRDIANFCVLFAGASLAFAQPTDSSVLKSVRMVRTDVAPVIDGVLDEGVWERAGKVTDFYEVSPDEYDEAAE